MHKKNFRPELEHLEDRTVPAQIPALAHPATADVHSAITKVLGEEALPQPHIQQVSTKEVVITWDGVESGEHDEHARVYVEYRDGSLKLSRSVSPQGVLIDVRSQHISAKHDTPELHIGPGSRTITLRIADEHFQQVFLEREYTTHNGFSDVIEVPSEHELEEILHARHEEEHARHTAFENLVHMEEHAKHAHGHAHSEHEHPHTHEEHAHAHEHAHVHAEHEHEHHHHHHEHEHEGHTEQELADVASLIGSYATPKSPAEAMALLLAREAKTEADSHHKEDHHGEKPAHPKHAHGKAAQHPHASPASKQHSSTEHHAPKGHDEPRTEPQETPAKEPAESATPKTPEKEEELSATHKGAIGAAIAGVLAYVPFAERLRRKKKAA